MENLSQYSNNDLFSQYIAKTTDSIVELHNMLRQVINRNQQLQNEIGNYYYVPFISNRADGVDGHYAIGRRVPGGYCEFWNIKSHKWSSCSDETLTLDQAYQVLSKLTIPTKEFL